MRSTGLIASIMLVTGLWLGWLSMADDVAEAVQSARANKFLKMEGSSQVSQVMRPKTAN